MYQTQQNQTLETNQLTNQTQNVINFNAIPQTNQPNIVPNINNTPQNIQNFNPQNNPQNNNQFNPTFNPTINPVFENKPTIIIQQKEQPKIEIKTTRTFIGPIKVGLEPKRMICPHCGADMTTQTSRSTNIKALATAIATLYIGFYLIQTCKSKPVSCDDCEHTCPECGHIIGKYYAM